MQPSPLATGSPLGSQPLGDAGKKGRGKKKKKEKLKNIPAQRGYFGIFIYYLKKKKKAEMRAEAPRPALVWMGTGCAWRGMLQSWLPAVF